jgi:hypothetical protein
MVVVNGQRAIREALSGTRDADFAARFVNISLLVR